MSAAAGNGPGATIKYLRRTTSGATGIGLGTAIKYLLRGTSGAAGYGLSRYRGFTVAPFHHKRPAFALFCVCLLRQQAEQHYRGPRFR
jgi:hypothetical protein